MKALLIGKIQKNGSTKRIIPSLIKFKDDIVRACQFALNMKQKNRNNAQMRRREVKHKQEVEQNWYKFSANEEWYEDKLDWSKAMINQDKTTDEMWTTFPEEEEQKISSTVTEGEELPYTYKNYIYREKNWKCPICSTEDYCGHYHCILYQEIHPKDRAYKIRPGRQCKCLKPSGSNSREGEDAY